MYRIADMTVGDILDKLRLLNGKRAKITLVHGGSRLPEPERKYTQEQAKALLRTEDDPEIPRLLSARVMWVSGVLGGDISIVAEVA